MRITKVRLNGDLLLLVLLLSLKLEASVLFMSPLVPLFGLLIVSALGFKVRINFLTYVLCCLHMMNVMNVTDLPVGVTPADLVAIWVRMTLSAK